MSTEVRRVGPDVELVLAIAILLGLASFAGGLWVGRSGNVGASSTNDTENSPYKGEEPAQRTTDIQTGLSEESGATNTAEQNVEETDELPGPNGTDREGKEGGTGRHREEGDQERVGNKYLNTADNRGSDQGVPKPDETSDVDLGELKIALESGETTDRIAAIRTLEELGSKQPELVEPVVENLKDLRLDSNDKVSRAAIEAASRIESARE